MADAAAQPAQPARITPDDIEAKFRELQGGVDEVADEAVNSLLLIGVAVAVGIVVVAYMIGKRRGHKRSAVVEVRRL